ncbi:Vacuolar protein sorting-associated protein 18 like protein [Homalodisca vitripennis]|nr:Vacuolar protein sorting-associated protein 18 like protein [Homalodisca vitripennis]
MSQKRIRSDFEINNVLFGSELEDSEFEESEESIVTERRKRDIDCESDYSDGDIHPENSLQIIDLDLDNNVESYGKLVSITKDPVKGTVWVIAERAVFRYKVTREERNVWQIYMEKGQFELAKDYCANNEAHLDQVLCRQADTYFNNQEYELSAIHYAETHSSFEEIALKFLQVWQIQALKTFLRKKLDKLRPTDQTQTTMIVMWVIELFMNQMGTLRNQGKEMTTEYLQLQQQLDEFLSIRQVEECVKRNKGTVYDLMASHGDKQSMIRLTIANKDFERVIQQHIHKGDFFKGWFCPNVLFRA